MLPRLTMLLLLALALFPAGCGGDSGSTPPASLALSVSSGGLPAGFVPPTGAEVECRLDGAPLAGDDLALTVTDPSGGAVSRRAVLSQSGPQAVTFTGLDLTSLADGTLTFVAALSRASAILAATTTAATLDTTGPAVSIPSPAPGAVLSVVGATLTAAAVDGAGVSHVEIFLVQEGLSQKVAHLTTAPFVATLDLLSPALSLGDGPATFTALATDALGHTRTSPPVAVTITGSAARPLAFILVPTVTGNPNPTAPLAAIATFRTTVPCRSLITIEDGARTFTAAFSPPRLAHTLPLLGFRPARSHAITIEVEDMALRTTRSAVPLGFTSPPLPPDFPPITVLVTATAQAEPGIRVLTFRQRGGGPTFRNGLVALDGEGQVVWYHTPGSVGEFERTPQGTFLYIESHFDLVEIDMLGNELTRWHATRLRPTTPPGAIAVDCDTIHHEVTVLPSGNILALSSERRTIPDYPSSETNTSAPGETAQVIADVVIEFQRDGTIVRRWSLFDVLDVKRLGYESRGPFWNDAYGMVTRDWTHGNAVAYDPADDSYTLSLRHQDAVVKISRATGQLVWILGTAANWKAPWSNFLLTAEPGTEEQYHQHAVKWLPNGNLLLFDNGNHRASPPDPEVPATSNYSRAVEFHVDPVAMTFEEAWVYGGPGQEIFYSPFICDADLLPLTGNVLVTDGGRAVDANGLPSNDIQGHISARIVEVTHTVPPVKVFEVLIDDTTVPRVSWQVYRSEHHPSLYP